MKMIVIEIEGYSPVKECIEQILHRGAYIGQAIKARNDNTEWNFIWMGRYVRKPNKLEQYLFTRR